MVIIIISSSNEDKYDYEDRLALLHGSCKHEPPIEATETQRVLSALTRSIAKSAVEVDLPNEYKYFMLH